MGGTARQIGLWAPPLLVMAAIFAFSQNPASAGEHSVFIFLGRKAGHLTGYALLMIALWRATQATIGGRRALIAAYAVTVVYAATDEYHQTFIRGRVGTWHDVVIDAVGAAIGALLLIAARRARDKRRAAAAAAQPA